MNMKLVLDYLAALEQNNNADWFHAHKAQYRAACTEFEAFVSELTIHLHNMDSSILPTPASELTFRLQRDTRFSHDKSPYNPAFRAHIGPCGKLPIPVGYFLFVQPGDHSFLGGGLFTDMFRDATKQVRDFIIAHGEELQRIVSAPAFLERFTLGGSALKNVPRGYDAAHPQAEFLKNKSWFIELPIADKLLLDGDFSSYTLEAFRAMQPLNSFLNHALDGFVMPQR